jgi:endonuclease-8
VYRRRTCLRCTRPVRVDEQGPPGQERTTSWCPSCQPGPGPDGLSDSR